MGENHKTSIIVALIGVVGTILAAIIGVRWGKDNVTVIVQLDGKNVVLNDADVQELASENEELRNKISEYEKQIENLESESNDLAVKLGAANGELDEVPTIEFQSCGLSVDGDEKVINKDKSYVVINGRQYYSKDFIDNLLPDNERATMKDGMLYIGKIVREKANLLEKPQIENYGGEIKDSITDTYGNVYSNALYFAYKGYSTTFNVERGYSNFKCTVAMKQDGVNRGYLQIETDDGNVVYTSSEITNLTEPFEVDIAINYTSKLVVKCIGEDGHKQIFIANAVLYNQE